MESDSNLTSLKDKFNEFEIKNNNLSSEKSMIEKSLKDIIFQNENNLKLLETSKLQISSLKSLIAENEKVQSEYRFKIECLNNEINKYKFEIQSLNLSLLSSQDANQKLMQQIKYLFNTRNNREDIVNDFKANINFQFS